MPAVWVVLVLLAAVFAFPGCEPSSAPIEEVNRGLIIKNEPAFTTTFAVEVVKHSNPTASTEIGWKPAYDIVNNTTKRITIKDVDVNFPWGIVQGSNARLELFKIQPSQVVDIYLSSEELMARHPSMTHKPPVELEPGSHIVVTFHQSLQLKLNGQVLVLPYGQKTVDYLGPLLHLPEEPEQKYRCVTNLPLDVTVRTSSGDIERTLPHVVLPDGCILNIPPPDPPPPR